MKKKHRKKHKRKLKKDSEVWMTTNHCTGRGTVIHISDKRYSCHVECGGEIYVWITPSKIIITE